MYLLTNGGQSYHVKWISAEDKSGQNEVSINQTILRDGSAPAPRLVFTGETEGGLVAVWEKLDGADLRIHNRDALPEAFRVLGRFHLARRSGGPIHSNITDKDYAAIGEMLRDELELHCSLLPDGQPIGRRCAPVLALLEQGFTTSVHGDFHPGNIIVNPRGIPETDMDATKTRKIRNEQSETTDERRWTQIEFRTGSVSSGFRGSLSPDSAGVFFIDWAYAHRGVNLLDLDYVQSVDLETEDGTLPWWTIGPFEAGSVLSAYFEACGLSDLDTTSVHRAVMLHSELRSHTNARKRGNDEGATVALRNVYRLLEP